MVGEYFVCLCGLWGLMDRDELFSYLMLDFKPEESLVLLPCSLSFIAISILVDFCVCV